MRNLKKYILALLLLFSYKATPFGSLDTTTTGTLPARVVEYTPTFGDSEYAKGTIEFRNGFTCISSNPDTTGALAPQIGVNGPVSGTINLNQGTMKLTSDLYLGDSVNFIGTDTYVYETLNTRGLVFLNGHTLYLNSDLTLSSGYLFFHSGVIDGMGHSIYLDGGAIGFYSATALGAGTITLRNLVIHNVQQRGQDAFEWFKLPNNFIIHGALVNFVFDNVTFVNKESTVGAVFTSGTINIVNQVKFTGNAGYYVLRNFYGIYINEGSQLYVGPGNTLTVWPRSGDIYFADKSSQLFLDTASLQPTLGNYYWTKGSLFVNGLCGLTCDAASLTCGGSTAADDLDLLLLPEAKLQIRSTGGASNRVVFNNYNRNNFWVMSPD